MVMYKLQFACVASISLSQFAAVRHLKIGMRTNIILNKSIPPRSCRTCGCVRSVQAGGAGLSGMMNIFGVCVCARVHGDRRNYIFSSRARSNKCFMYRIPISLNLRHCVPCARSTVPQTPVSVHLLVRRTRACQLSGMH